ncbi:MAG: hypothetical protein A2085_07660 [Gemmatimonadetes bacterium GWC2_71_10]|nr:MAG: hypothetical protein A2085_07660 [Gemmatimonadetes bacterium GWC2_71_10]
MNRSSLIVSFAAIALLTGCVRVSAHRTVSPGAAEAEIRATLQRTADAWNAADLPGHVAAYADSATMMGGRGLITGRDTIAAGLRRSFWREGRPLQQLRYEDVVVRMLGERFALVTGGCVLSGGGRADYTCRFSLTWAYHNGRWVMIHDHSS